ncbi:docking protein 1-like [Clinocottus analis]|uniref:docking protein 1-like n=1 Tax=Clinocottus analis TaxID=304258 RepID=UPI0035BF6DC0
MFSPQRWSGIKEKWKPVWLSLFPPSSGGVGRLEIQNIGGDHVAGVRKHHQPHVDRKLKVVHLSELINVLRLPPNAEACPMENMSAFCVETQDRTMVFAAVKEACVGWVEILCQSTFQRGVGSDSSQFKMEENQLYASVDEASQFLVTVQRTDAATRCGLKGSYWLQVGQEAMLLRETQEKKIVREWSYELLRRYGKDKLAFTIEAGRRCDSGPGTFTFETQQADTIFSLIQSTINRKTSALTLGNPNQEEEKVIEVSIRAHSPLPKIPDVTSTAAILDHKQGSQSAALQESARAQEGLGGLSESVSVQPPPITLMPLPLVPTQSISGRHLGGQSEAVYANPADCIRSVAKARPTMALYVDPASILPLKPPSSQEAITPPTKSWAPPPRDTINHLEPVYSEVYDKISPVQNKPAKIQSKGKVERFADDEPIYTEPMSKKEEVSLKKESKADPFAHLYAKVCKTPPPTRRSASSNTIPSCSSSSTSLPASMSTARAKDPSLDDVIYENLGII